MGQPPILQPEYRAGSPAFGTQSADSAGNSLLGWACGGLPGDGPPTSLPESRRATLLAGFGLRLRASTTQTRAATCGDGPRSLAGAPQPLMSRTLRIWCK